MTNHFSRRSFLQTSALSDSAALLPGMAMATETGQKTVQTELNKNPLKIGLMTYTLGKDWDIETIIKNCTETQWKSVELRTTHKHGVELTLSPSQRADVKKRFKDSPLETISLASAFQYHSPDKDELKKNIDGTKEFVKLAHDVGATGMGIPFMDAENPTAVQTVDGQMDARFYPNPFNSAINMKLNSTTERIQIYNLAGTLIQTIIPKQENGQTLKFGTDVKSGMYLVKVTESNSVKSYKIVKN